MARENEEATAETEKTSEEESSVETSLEEFLQRKERRAARPEDADEEEALLEAMEEREARGSETLSVQVVPEQPNEFTCRSCFLVKHRSQLRNAKKMLCNDCA
jgi:hypothetical protein